MNDARSNFERRGGGARIGSFYPRFPSTRRGKRIRFIVKSDRFPAFMGRVASVLEKKKRKKKYRAPLIACVYVCVCVRTYPLPSLPIHGRGTEVEDFREGGEEVD